MKGFILFLVAYILGFFLTIVNFFFVSDSEYFEDTSISLDRFGNREYRTLFNRILIKKESEYRFGDIRETISSVLGKNQEKGTLTRTGKILAFILNTLEKDHCKNAIRWYDKKSIQLITK